MTQPLDREPPLAGGPASDVLSKRDAGSDADSRPLPVRPVLVELASALLIVGAITALVGWVGAQILNVGVAANAGLLPAIFVALNVAAIAMGIATFYALFKHRAWFDSKDAPSPNTP